MAQDFGNGVKVNFNLTLAGRRVRDAVREGFADCGMLVQKTAKFYAPVSPIQKQKITRVRRRPSKTRALSGGLEKSIQMEVKPEGACVFVPSNSMAGKYAKVIHDMKGVRWWRRGLGTQRKGAQADEKFIERALHDKIGDVERILTKAMQRGLAV